ncbi:MAG: 23S rRNA (pseudouridine(1915)-N(3))-methyltransferase RlmH [Gammaproteobacteria bacterium]|nr:23S rRNA (pseudouridine(1915)-N(3))-methyltransferase RlmH [Gammaproteobacteria bacterium]MDH3465775.1 23S rRNA (pseudouridine(1915)-N(3))-methyltransferase RlmH [Gammaproteobacteria bacterium]
MRIQLIAAGRRMPSWVQQGYEVYAKRLPRYWHLELLEIPLGKRTASSDVARAVTEEGDRMLAAIGASSRVVAFDERGRSMATEELAKQLATWMADAQDVALLIGGPDGLADSCRRRADEIWSLSNLTLAHPVVRIVIAEQLYRAHSIIQGAPYHRDG